ncbi:MAG: class I SAM-dependent methyltransferase [Sphingomonadales bacterium]
MSFDNQMPAEIAANLILQNLKTKKAKVLDVGCGDGVLLNILAGAGCVCTGLEKSADAPAKAKGLDIRIATWPDFDEAGFDAIIFVRTLHHILPLKPAVKKAKALLAPGGFVFVDDFAFAEANAATSAWMYEMVQLLASQNLIDPSLDEFVAEVYKSRGILAPWKKEYVKDLNSAGDMEKALKGSFPAVEMKRVPYIYRYVTRTLVEGQDKEKLARKILEMETRAGEKYPGILIGRQFLAQ